MTIEKRFPYATEERFPIWIEYSPTGASHNHLLTVEVDANAAPLADIVGNSESYAEELAESVARCNEDRHDGHGEKHEEADIQEAFRIGMHQLLSKNFAQDWKEIKHREEMYRKWGGHMPAGVIYPDQNNDWQVMVPDKEGNPWITPMRKGALDLPEPQDMEATPDTHGIGWKVREESRAQRRYRLREERKKNA